MCGSGGSNNSSKTYNSMLKYRRGDLVEEYIKYFQIEYHAYARKLSVIKTVPTFGDGTSFGVSVAKLPFHMASLEHKRYSKITETVIKTAKEKPRCERNARNNLIGWYEVQPVNLEAYIIR